jgi:hypothetical protein
MPALQSKFLALNIHPRHRLGGFIYSTGQFFGNRRDFRATPQLTLVATGALLRVNLNYLQFLLPVEKGS